MRRARLSIKDIDPPLLWRFARGAITYPIRRAAQSAWWQFRGRKRFHSAIEACETTDFLPTRTVEAITSALKAKGVTVRPYQIDYNEYDEWKSEVYDRHFPRAYIHQSRNAKIMEHYLSFIFLNINKDHVYLDVASCRSTAPDVLKRLYGLRTVYRQDLIYAHGIHGEYIGGNANSISLPDNSVDIMGLHNSFEHFEADADIGFLSEAHRILRPGGRICIIPFFLADRFYVLTSRKDIRRYMHVPHYDRDALLVISEACNFFPLYSKHYDANKFADDIHDGFKNNYAIEVVAIDDPRRILSCPFALILSKSSTNG